MGKLVGVGATKKVKTYTEEEVTLIKEELEGTIAEMTAEKANLEVKIAELEGTIAEFNKKSEKNKKNEE